MTNSYIIDFIFFELRKGEHTIKELAIADVDGDIIRHVFFKPPQDFYEIENTPEKKIIREVQAKTGLLWNHGFEDYDNLCQILLRTIPQHSTVYVKGYQKADTIRKHTNSVNVINLDDYNCPSLEVLSYLKKEHFCPFNHNLCAARNVKCIGIWWSKQKVVYETIESVGRCIEAIYNLGYRKADVDILKYLPKEFHIRYSHIPICQIYNDLPKHLKNDKDILRELPCTEHGTNSIGDEWDGPGIKKKDCYECNSNI